MPVIHSTSPPITAEDMMATSAFEVSPILTASIFDEIYTSIVEDDAPEEQDTLPPATTMHQALPPPLLQRQRRRRATPLGRLNTSHGDNGVFELPPPSARWTRRLSSMRRINNEQGMQEAEEENHIGPVMLMNHTSFPRPDAPNFMYGQHCLNDCAYNTSPLLQQEQSTALVHMLDFDVVYDDGGQYGQVVGYFQAQ